MHPYAFKYKLPIIGFPYKLHESQTLLRVIFEQLHFMVERNKITRNFLSFVSLFPLSSNIRTIGFVSCLNWMSEPLFRFFFLVQLFDIQKKNETKREIINTKSRYVWTQRIVFLVIHAIVGRFNSIWIKLWFCSRLSIYRLNKNISISI